MKNADKKNEELSGEIQHQRLENDELREVIYELKETIKDLNRRYQILLKDKDIEMQKLKKEKNNYLIHRKLLA